MNPIDKIKSIFSDRAFFKHMQLANDESVVKPFLHGSQLKTRKFANYLFLKENDANLNILKTRDFIDFKTELKKSTTIELSDEILSMGSGLMYNKSYNILIVTVAEKDWEVFNKAVSIGKKTKTDLEIQRDIIINAYKELAS